jgi:branched-chain amino acid aminotransferase
MHHCYLNGEVKPITESFIHISDLGLLRGYGLFDYFRTYNGKPFQWELYWKRFDNSAQKMGIENPIAKETAYEIVTQLIQKSGLKECAIRFVLTGGYSPDGMSTSKPNLLMISEDIHHVDALSYQSGMKVMTYEFVRDIPEVKSTDYKHLLILQPTIKKAGVSDVLFHKNGEVSELSRSNVFHFKNNVLVTPNENILNGITRQTVLELALGKFKIEERPVSLAEFLNADEVFTTSSTKRILHISKIDDKVIGNGKIGKNTKVLQDQINSMTQNW